MKPTVKVKADKAGWKFYDTISGAFLGKINYTGWKGPRCKQFLESKKHLK